MCDHCGCRDYAPIAELTAEHEEILGLAWDLAERGGAPDVLLAALDAHVVKEETGLYPAAMFGFDDDDWAKLVAR